MLALALTNLVGVLLFASVYAAAGARVVSQPAFVVSLLVVFACHTALWLRVEGGEGHRLDAMRRLGRGVFGLVLVLIGAPVAILLPLFALEGAVPPEAAAQIPSAAVMVLVLVALALVVVVNLVGAAVIVTRAASRPRSSR